MLYHIQQCNTRATNEPTEVEVIHTHSTMEKNIIILAVVLSMLGFIALGGLYSLCWREALREDIAYAREIRHRRPSLETQGHSRSDVRNRSYRRAATPVRQSQTPGLDEESSRVKGREKQEGECTADNGHWGNEREAPKSTSGGWSPSDGLASGETAANSEWDRGAAGETRRETSPERPTSSENADRWSGDRGSTESSRGNEAPAPVGGW